MEGLTVVATTRTADAKHPPSYSPGGAKVHPFFAFTLPSQRAFRSVPSVFARLTAVTVYICRFAACRPAGFDECKYDDVLVYVAGVSGRVAMQ